MHFCRLLSALLAPALLLSAGLAADAPAGGFVRLFNGKDLSNWDGDPQLWSVRDGMIVARRVQAVPGDQGNTFLIWKGGAVADFELHASVRLLAENRLHWANSGIQYRSRVVDPARWVVRGYQADMDESGRYVGQLYEEGYRGFLALPGQRVRILPGEPKPRIEVLGATADAAAVAAAYHRDDWNEYVIIAEGNHLRQWVNGVLTAEATDLDSAHAAARGVLALQLHAGQTMAAEFRDILYKPLP